jgi:hypothetical protein
LIEKSWEVQSDQGISNQGVEGLKTRPQADNGRQVTPLLAKGKELVKQTAVTEHRNLAR